MVDGGVNGEGSGRDLLTMSSGSSGNKPTACPSISMGSLRFVNFIITSRVFCTASVAILEKKVKKINLCRLTV